jgi:predicted DsbA family dithiol-disulfide isomerase
MKIEIFSDIACPWCYVGKRRLEQALDEFEHRDDVAIEWKSFELAPQMPAASTLNTAEYLTSVKGIAPAQAQHMIAQTTKIAEADGLEMRFDTLKLFNTRNAHQLLHYAKTVGLQAALKERLFRAAFTEGRELGDPAVLVDLAVEVGLDALIAKEVLQTGRYRPAVIADEQAAQAAGARGVPFYIIDSKYVISGAQSVSVFKTALETAWRESSAQQKPSNSNPAAACGPDSCTI